MWKHKHSWMSPRSVFVSPALAAEARDTVRRISKHESTPSHNTGMELMYFQILISLDACLRIVNRLLQNLPIPEDGSGLSSVKHSLDDATLYVSISWSCSGGACNSSCNRRANLYVKPIHISWLS